EELPVRTEGNRPAVAHLLVRPRVGARPIAASAQQEQHHSEVERDCPTHHGASSGRGEPYPQSTRRGGGGPAGASACPVYGGSRSAPRARRRRRRTADRPR